VLAAFEGAATDPELAALADALTAARAGTAAWLVDQLRRKASLRTDGTRQDAIDTVWILMDPAVFDRLTRRLAWSARQYQRWFASSVGRLLTDDPT
jgi:hypothetical protein